jgi:transposase
VSDIRKRDGRADFHNLSPRGFHYYSPTPEFSFLSVYQFPLQYGLLKGSFIPPRSQRELRDLTRHRTQLVEEETLTANRIHKVLEDANIKLSSVATDVLGVSGRAMLEALIQGEKDPVKLDDLAQRRLRGKIPELEKALEGHLTEHQTRPFAAEIDRLDAVPGGDRRVAEVVLAEVGVDMKPFPTHENLAA